MSSQKTDDLLDAEIEQQTYWAMVPEWVIFHKELTPEAKVMYMTLARLANASRTLWRSQAHIAEKLGISERAVGRAMAKLQEHGALVLRKRRYNSSAMWWLPFDRPVFTEAEADALENGQTSTSDDQKVQQTDRTSTSDSEPTRASGEKVPTGRQRPTNESQSKRANNPEPGAFLANQESERLHPGLRAEASKWVIAEALTQTPRLTESNAKAIRKLRKHIDEWLQVGYPKDQIANAIAVSPYKTHTAVDGQLRKLAREQTGLTHSVGNDTLAAAGSWLGKTGGI